MTRPLMLFVFSHPVDFPCSEYGGLWVVRAYNAREAAHLAWTATLEKGCTGDSVPGHFAQAAELGKCLMLKSFPEDVPCVIQSFLT